MAGAPKFKVYAANGVEYLAATKYAEDAAVLVSALGPGATIRTGHARKDTVWMEGDDGNAGDSYDAVAEHVAAVVMARNAARAEKHRKAMGE